jgi:hypothetical protein
LLTDPQRHAVGGQRVAARAAAAVTAVCALAVLAVQVAAQVALPGSSASPQPGFDACALPCWAGVTPGVTIFADAPDRVSAHVGGNVMFRTTGDRLLFEIGPGPQLSGAIYNDRGRVDSLRLETRFPLWRLVDTLGTPRCALAGRVSGGQWRMTVYWDMEPGIQIAALAVLNTPDDWQPGTPMRTLLVLTGTDSCRDTGAHPWTGFAPLWHYS